MSVNVIDVFIEGNCNACREVLEVIDSFMKHHRITLRIYEREEHRNVFQDRSIVVCPATFINNRLAFYGAFSPQELSRCLKLNK